MMTPPESLQQDHATLTQILDARRAVTTVTMPIGVQLLWRVYLTILEDAVTTLSSLINYLGPESS